MKIKYMSVTEGLHFAVVSNWRSQSMCLCELFDDKCEISNTIYKIATKICMVKTLQITYIKKWHDTGLHTSARLE